MRSTHRSLAFLDQRLNCPNPLQEENIRSSKLAPFVCSPNRWAKWLGGPPNLQVEQRWGGRNEDQGPNHGQEASLASCAVGFFGWWCDPLVVVSWKTFDGNHHPKGRKSEIFKTNKRAKQAGRFPLEQCSFHLSSKVFQESLMQTPAQTSFNELQVARPCPDLLSTYFPSWVSPKHWAAAPQAALPTTRTYSRTKSHLTRQPS